MHMPPKNISTEAVAQLDQMIGEIIKSSPYGIVILYIEQGKLIRAVPGMIGPNVRLEKL